MGVTCSSKESTLVLIDIGEAIALVVDGEKAIGCSCLGGAVINACCVSVVVDSSIAGEGSRLTAALTSS